VTVDGTATSLPESLTLPFLLVTEKSTVIPAPAGVAEIVNVHVLPARAAATLIFAPPVPVPVPVPDPAAMPHVVVCPVTCPTGLTRVFVPEPSDGTMLRPPAAASLNATFVASGEYVGFESPGAVAPAVVIRRGAAVEPSAFTSAMPLPVPSCP